MRVGIVEKVFKVRGQRSLSHVYKCVNVITAKECVYTVWSRGLLVRTYVNVINVCWIYVPAQGNNKFAKTKDYRYTICITRCKVFFSLLLFAWIWC